MTFRAKIIIVVAAVVVVLGGVVGFFIWRSRQAKPVATPPPTGQLPAAQAPAATDGVPALPETKTITPAQVSAAAREVAIKNQVKNFVERFGSYSQDANYANLAEIQPIITASVAQWLKNYPKTLKEKEPAGFIGVSTFVVSQKINQSDASSAEVLASVQREETTVAGVSRYYKDILVKLVLVGDTWKIDGAYWQ